MRSENIHEQESRQLPVTARVLLWAIVGGNHWSSFPLPMRELARAYRGGSAALLASLDQSVLAATR
jgi:hypothetical protein